MVDLGIKSAVKDWMNNKYENWIKQPISRKTEELENLVAQQVQTYGNKAKQTVYDQPKNYYQNQPTFYRGLFWIGVGLLIVLWIISGS